MKRLISVILAVVTVLCMDVCAFAAENARFGVTVVSENDKTAVISIDYNGGAAFNALDFEVKISDKVELQNCEKGTGFNNFMLSIQSNNTVLSFNPETNPIKFGFAALDAFKVIKGKDLLVLTLKKKTSAKLTSNEVKLTVTNCAAIDDENVTVNVGVTVTQLDGNAAALTQKSEKTQATTAKTKNDAAVAQTTATTTAVAESTKDGQVDTTGEYNEDTALNETQTKTEEKKQTTDRKKIIIIVAAAVALLLVIAAALVLIAHKYRKND